jgi:hypothetical protein
MPRWEAVATFALVAFVLCAIYAFAVAVTLEQVEHVFIGYTDPFAVALALWLTPSLALMALAIRAGVWRREHPIADALLLTPICLAMPSLAVVTYAVTICVTGGCSS